MIRTAILLLVVASVGLSAQTWEREGSLKRWTGGAAITSPYVGCATLVGDPTVQTGAMLSEVALETGKATQKAIDGAEGWMFLPRQPRIAAKSVPGSGGAIRTTVSFRDVWNNAALGSIEIELATELMDMDVTDTWVSPDGDSGCVVFAPKASTPDTLKEYAFAFFTGTEVTFMQRINPKVDVDIYVRQSNEGIRVYLRGNGISFPPSEEEVFTNASYLVYRSNGSMSPLSLPTRGPGSGKGRSIIWHSNKWDRLVLTDEFASGALLVKASNGIVVDSITQSQIDPSGSIKILSASGNNRDTWMATHATVGNKNVLILWAMPDIREVTHLEFGSGDNAKKQMPSSDWDVIIPFVSSNGSTNTLFYWDPADVVSVDEDLFPEAAVSVYPNPTHGSITVSTPHLQGAWDYVVVDAVGSTVLVGTTSTGTIDVSPLPSGSYTIAHRSGVFRAPLQILR